MSTLSRTFARASRRGKRLMEQYQPAGAYKAGEKEQAAKLAQEKKPIKATRRAETRAR